MPPLRSAALCVLRFALPFGALAPAAAAQPFAFGSADDPLEPGARRPGRLTTTVAAYAGPAWIGGTWRLALAAEAEGYAGPLSAALGGALHPGPGGLYDAEADEAYDLARVVRYLRHEPRPGVPLYARLGPTQHLDLGVGHLVRDFGTTAAWDERDLGAEAMVRTGFGSIAAFTDDVRLDGVVGAQVEIEPLTRSTDTRLRSLRLAAGAVHDFALGGDSAVTAVSADVRVALFELGGLRLSPFASYARYLQHGQGVGLGADFGANELAGMARLRLRMALFVSGEGFIPGYFGPLYTVSHNDRRIVLSDTYYDDDPSTSLEGVSLDDVTRGVDLVTELRVLTFGALLLHTYFRRHYGGGERLSEFTLRLAAQPRATEGVRFAFVVQREALGGFFSIFGPLEDRNTLLFEIASPVGPAHLHLRARYGYLRLPDDAEGHRRFLVERRFEPLVGLRVPL
ncbi:MAG TPA: hypothetical protein VD962_12450 [Rubricoccaceae bacterium]|nr:hypothetical protein [Rubricoccaceae bacterium]